MESYLVGKKKELLANINYSSLKDVSTIIVVCHKLLFLPALVIFF